ncbi:MULTISPECIES: CHC2 zinc finger domain-containing protein [Mycobacteroides]|uniref:CHC2 zinc finger domain-containing protein n=1 Tax=Mycobacteroides chelonae TaxID=1774 RepID=UPI0004AB83E2
MLNDYLIVKAIRKYFPDWEPPSPNPSGNWTSTLCPFHGDTNKSASVSYEYEAFHCFVCGVKGDALKIIREQEEVTFAEAVRIAEELSPGGNRTLPTSHVRKPRRRIFGDSGPGVSVHKSGDGRIQTGVRGRSTPWS